MKNRLRPSSYGIMVSSVTLEEYEKIFKEANERFSDCLGDKADLSAFAVRGGKLIVKLIVPYLIINTCFCYNQPFLW